VSGFTGFIDQLAARTPAPGGGAAAAIAAALGAAAGAMAARYTTGAKWADRSADAERLGQVLHDGARRLLALADADAGAYAAVQATAAGSPERAAAEAAAGRIPLDTLIACADAADALARFLERCNPRLRSDVETGIHLLAGAGRAAWRTLLINQPDGNARTIAGGALTRLAAAEAALGPCA
jgi:formiminotetrahydrofolate cyclodeaminase